MENKEKKEQKNQPQPFSAIAFFIMSGMFLFFAATTPKFVAPPCAPVVYVLLFMAGLTGLCGLYQWRKEKKAKKEKEPKDYEPIG